MDAKERMIRDNLTLIDWMEIKNLIQQEIKYLDAQLQSQESKSPPMLVWQHELEMYIEIYGKVQAIIQNLETRSERCDNV